MQRFRTRVFLFLVLLEAITACQNTEEKQAAFSNVPRTELTQAVKKDSLTNSIFDRCMLSVLIKNRDLQKLDSVSCIVDGEQSESLAMTASELWKHQFQPLIAYLATHPKGCLRQQLVWGLSEDLSVNPERIAAIKVFKAQVAKNIKKSTLTAEEQGFLRNLVADIRPEIFD